VPPKPYDPFVNVSKDTFIIDDNSKEKYNKPKTSWDNERVASGPWYDKTVFYIGETPITLG